MSERAFMDQGLAAKWDPKVEELDDENFTRCVEAASTWLERVCHRRFKSGTYTALHSGDRARQYSDGSYLYLADPVTGFSILPVTSLTSVSEDGVALTSYVLNAAPAFEDGEAVLVHAAGGRLRRVTISSGRPAPRAWAAGLANLKVVCTAGYLEAVEPKVPEDLIQLAIELAWLFYREGGRLGVESLTEGGLGMASYARLLTPNAKRTLDLYSIPASPVTLEA